MKSFLQNKTWAGLGGRGTLFCRVCRAASELERNNVQEKRTSEEQVGRVPVRRNFFTTEAIYLRVASCRGEICSARFNIVGTFLKGIVLGSLSLLFLRAFVKLCAPLLQL